MSPNQGVVEGEGEYSASDKVIRSQPRFRLEEANPEKQNTETCRKDRVYHHGTGKKGTQTRLRIPECFVHFRHRVGDTHLLEVPFGERKSIDQRYRIDLVKQ